MGYKNKTNFYRIPVMGAGDIMTQEQNWKQMSIVDNLLYAATFGCSQCFLEQGKYSIDDSPFGNVCNLLIQPYDTNSFSLMGILNYRMFYSKEKLKIGPLYYDLRYYVYVEYDNIMETNPQGFSIKSYTSKQDSWDGRMLLCILELGDRDKPVINIDVNKVFSKNILSHTKDNSNPHGITLYQDNLEINNKLIVNDYPVYGAYYFQFETKKNNNFSFQIPEGMKVMFVSAYPESTKAGFISWEIVDKTIWFYNSNNVQGVKVNVKLDLRSDNNDL